MQWGEREQFLRDMAAQGEDVPALRSRPDVRGDLAFYWNAFQDLHTCRERGFTLGPVPWSAIDAWARRHGVFGGAFDRLVTLIGAMDDAYLEFQEKRQDERRRSAH